MNHPPTVNTATVSDRRLLRFESIPQMLAEVDRLVAAEEAGRLRALGNWTLGQALNHLAVWAEYSFSGAPLKPPFFIRWYFRLMKSSVLRGPMRPGVRIPGVPGGTLGTEVVSTTEALPRLQRAMERLANEAPLRPNVIFGPLTHEEWIALNLGHAQLHLSFFQPENSSAV